MNVALASDEHAAGGWRIHSRGACGSLPCPPCGDEKQSRRL